MNKLALATLSVLALGISYASAQTDDLILSFDDTSGLSSSGSVVSTDLEYDLGPLSNYTTTTASETLLNVNSLLTTLYPGSGSTTAYSTSGGIRWDVAGGLVGNGASDDGVGIDITTTKTTQNPGNTTGENGNIGLLIGNVQSPDSNTTVEGTTSYGNIVEDYDANSFHALNSGSNAGFGGIQNDETIGASSITLEEFDYNNSPAKATVGTFTLSNTGALTFVGASEIAVPEPSTYALFISGALLLFVALRRRKSGV